MPRRPLAISSAIVSLVLLTGACQAQSQAYQGGLHTRSVITQPVEESRLVTLTGNTRPEANARNDRGRVEDALPLEHMLLQLQRPPEAERELVSLIDEMHRPGSPVFHQWILPSELGARFGVSQSDVEKITDWLQSHGFKVNTVFPTGVVIDFSGSAGEVREAFHTEIHNLEVNGEAHIANMSDPRIPAALAGAVQGVVSLHNFMPHPMHKMSSEYTFSSGSNTYYGLVPADLATIYNLNPLFAAGYTGTGQTVVVIEDTNVYNTGDWTTFRNEFGLSGYTAGSFTQVHPGGCTDPGVTGAEIEAALDAQWSSAAAPNAHIELASCADTGVTFGGLLALENLVNAGSPPAIMSISYGECEALDGASANAAFKSAYQSAVAAGVSVFVSAGDEGAASCDANDRTDKVATHGIGVSGWTSTVYNVSVGGTDYSDTYAGTSGTYWNATNGSTYGSAISYIPEIPWNDSCASELISTFVGYSSTYGTSGFCNSAIGEASFLNIAGGSGGPSACATGNATISGVVSGTCAGYPKPSWQSVLGNPADGVRDVPDVSLFAANGVWGHFYIFCDTDPSDKGTCTGAPSGWLGAGGTSFSSPIMAGIMALINQKQGAAQGNPNPRLYALAGAEYGASGSSICNSSNGNSVGSFCIFYDVTQGDMDVNCTGANNCYLPSGTYGVLSTSNSAYDPAFGTATGWDFATGIGTVNAYNLVFGWTPSASVTAVASSLNPSTVGQSVTFTATVTPAGPPAPTGTVSFTSNGTAVSGCSDVALSSSRTAACTTTFAAVGTYSIEAAYSGNANYNSSSGTLSQVVNKPAPVVTVVSSLSPSMVGQSVTLTATVTPSGPTPTGTVSFTSNATSLTGCSGLALSGSLMAACTSSTLPVGTDTIVATYSGDSYYASSTGLFPQLVNPIPTPVQYVPVTPCRVVDTRTADGPFGGPALAAGVSRSFTIPSGPCAGIPATATAYSLNVTVVPPAPLGYLTIWPAGEGQPTVSTLNSLDGRIKANAAIVPSGTGGAVTVYANNNTNVVLDINGYFQSSSGSTLEFYPLTPCRVADTRKSSGYASGLGSPSLIADTERDFPILSASSNTVACDIPSTAQAYSLNFTAIPPGGGDLGYLTVWPEGETQPVVSTLNDLTGTVVANAALVPAGTGGGVAVYPSNDTDLVIDVNGYFAPAATGGLQLYTVTPCRALDTRKTTGAFTGELTVNVAGGACAPPSTAQAYVFNATVVPSGDLGYLTLWPDTDPQPVVSTLNALDGAITSNMATVPNLNGKTDAYASGTTQLIMDISAYFAP
ncbi:MAG: Ig-like domain repeat protein [Terriglobales bacterium]|jgi:hypothetical protein